MKKLNGFTLLEMLVSISCLLICLTLCGSAFMKVYSIGKQNLARLNIELDFALAAHNFFLDTCGAHQIAVRQNDIYLYSDTHAYRRWFIKNYCLMRNNIMPEHSSTTMQAQSVALIQVQHEQMGLSIILQATDGRRYTFFGASRRACVYE